MINNEYEIFACKILKINIYQQKIRQLFVIFCFSQNKFYSTNKNESSLFEDALSCLKAMAKQVGLKLKGIIMSLDGVYDGRKNRKLIFNANRVPNIPVNKRNRKKNQAWQKAII